MRRIAWISVSALVIALTVSGCGTDDVPEPAPAAATTEASPVAPVAVGTSVYLRVNRPLTVRKAPSARAAVVTRLAATTEMGSKRVLAVAPASTETEGWVHVALPDRPNGSTGWVPAAQVRLVPVHDSILVDLSSRKLWQP